MGQVISILYAGERTSEAIASQIRGKLLEKTTNDIQVLDYKIDDPNNDETSYLDRVGSYVLKVSSADRVIIVLSKKYLTESIFCQEEIRGIVNRHENKFRGNVFAVFSNEETQNHITDEANNNKLKTNAHSLIEIYFERLKKVSVSQERLSQINYCMTTISTFLYELKEKRDFTYKNNEIDRLVTDVVQNILNKADKNYATELEKFLKMFSSCLSGETVKEYGDPLLIDKSLNNDLTTINRIYKKCMLPESVNINIVNLLANASIESTEFQNLKEDTNSYITIKFYSDYYLMPKATKYDLRFNGDINDGHELDSESFVNNLEDDFDDGKLVYLIGGVGEGKSTFVKKIIYDLSLEKNNTKYKLIYYRFNGEDNIDKIFKILNNEIDKQKKNLLFIDELDSFSHVYERFMFTDDGYRSFQEQINKTKKVIEGLKNLLLADEVQSIMVSVRPYVLSHFKSSTLINLNRNGSLYKLQYSEDAGEKIMRKRIELFKHIISDVKKSNQVREGTKKVIDQYHKEITTQIDTKLFEILPNGKKREHIIQNGDRKLYVPIPKKHDPINRLLKLSTHGFRTLITLYHDLGYNPKLYHSYFSNTIFLFYALGLYKKYCQILPLKYNNNPKENFTGKIYNYPNMFLSIASSETNKDINCAIPHTITYWLKIFLLDFIHKNENISIAETLKNFNTFDRGLVLIALGSLGTINEYNCIEYNFPTSRYDLEGFLISTKAKLTRRGIEIISNDKYLDYNNLEFFVDDWQLPKPKIEVILGEDYEDKDFYLLLKRLTSKNFTYEHLTGEQNNDFRFKDFILDKSRLVIWYTYIFEISLQKEKQYYHIESFQKGTDFLKNKRKQIMSEANAIYMAHYPSAEINLTGKLNEFNTQCTKSMDSIKSFFDEVFEKEIKVSCFKC